MKDFVNLIIMAQNDNEEALLELIRNFMPIINKYSKLMNYDDDFKGEMILKFIQFIKIEFDLRKLDEINNYIIIKYIQSSLYHHYILLSKKISEKSKMESSLINDGIPDTYNIPYHDERLFIIKDTIRSMLTDKEFHCINLIIFKDYTAEQVASSVGVTKQAINQCKKRALRKLKILFE